MSRFSSNGDPRRFYSWTTREQLQGLRRGEPLLTKVRSEVNGYATFDHYISFYASSGHGSPWLRGLGRLLFHEAFARKRFAWTNAFGTALGLGGGPFGPVLLCIDLRPEAIVVRLKADNVVVDGEVLGAPGLSAVASRIAAVELDTGELREYALVNESMIAKVTVGDAETLEKLALERSFVQALGSALEAGPSQVDPSVWRLFAGIHPQTAGELARIDTLLDETIVSSVEDTFNRGYGPASFSLGPLRAPLPPICHVVGRRAEVLDRSYPERWTSALDCDPAHACRQAGPGDRPYCEPKPLPLR